MRTTRDRQDTGRSDPAGPGLFGPGFSGPGAGGWRPWFGPKRAGFGYRPQTWQGWAVTAVMAAVILTAGALAPNTPWLWLAVIVAVLIPFAIIAVQRPGR